MSDRRVQIYVAIVCIAGAVCLGFADWSSLAELPRESVLGLVGLVAIALLSESLAIGLSVGGGKSSITFLPLLASVQLFGPVGGLALIVPTMAFVEFVVRRKTVSRGLFNVAQAVVGTTLAGSAFQALGGTALEGLANPSIASQLGPFIVFGLIFLGVNHAAVSMALALSQGVPFRRVWEQVLSNSGGRLNDILISPIALAVAFLYVQFGIAGILVILLPMLFIRYSYLTTSKLRESNEDLLTALVKAIETRDPYTSGHSQRVSLLAGQIAEAMGMNRINVERTKMAALLHDIGKIEAVYTEILRKPDSLTPEERAIIESHVTRGEQLLRDLASVPQDVVLAVRHHHEREDGKGYPDGLVGDDIPIGAKIIVVCDAVDAMLSDRPYRRALPVPAVLDQLKEHAGTQFDLGIVKLLLRSEILAAFADMMREEREKQREKAEDLVETVAGVTPLPVPSMRNRPHRLRRYN
jgi:putative nucleotidyltransferase with HDIG domain